MPVVPVFVPAGAPLGAGPCQPWIDWDDVTVCRTDLGDVTDPDVKESILDEASELLYLLTLGFYPGECSVVLDVCLPCACRRDPCRCEPLHGLDLTDFAPVVSVTAVTINGAELDVDAYVLRQSVLYRVDGSPWPTQRSSILDPDAFTVAIKYGANPSAGARGAAAAFAAELAAACAGHDCGIRQNVRTVQREGKSYVFYDSSEMIEKGLTNVRRTDNWLAAWRNARAYVGAGMMDPAECAHLTVAGDSGAS